MFKANRLIAILIGIGLTAHWALPSLAQEAALPLPLSNTQAASVGEGNTISNNPPILLNVVKQVPGPPRYTNSGKVSKKFAAYTITIQNKGSSPLMLTEANLPQHITPEAAYRELKSSPGKQYALSAGLGLALAPITFGVSFALGLVIFGPIAAVMTGSSNKDMLKHVSKYKAQFPLEIISPGESRQTQMLLPLSTQPIATIQLQDPQTAQVLQQQFP